MADRYFETFDRAVDSYQMPVKDLAVFRIVYALFVLVSVVPKASWLPNAPQAFFYPPIGLAALFTTPPPPIVLLVFNILLTLFALMLLVGWMTRIASWGTGLTLLAVNSWAFSLGKINHGIFLVVIPIILSFSGWSRTLSVDAGNCASERERESGQAWPLALLALLVGLAMFKTGADKAATGWLDSKKLCTYGHFIRNYLFTGRETWSASLAMYVDSDWFWKMADWSVVVLEIAFLPATFNRRFFSFILALATLFHLGVLLLFAIPFGANIIAYGAFVRYSHLPFLSKFNLPSSFSKSKVIICGLAMFAIVFGAILHGQSMDTILRFSLNKLVVWVGAMIGTGYILSRICQFRVGDLT